MPGLEQHAEHPPPQLHGRQFAKEFQFSPFSPRFVGDIRGLEGYPNLVVQIRTVAGRKERPLLIFHHPLHEQIGNPVRRVHVMGAAAIVAGVLAQLQKLFDIEVPGFQIRTDSALAFTALVNRNGRIVDDLQEGHDPLALAISPLDVTAQRPHGSPVVAQTTGKFRQQRIFLDRLVDAVQIVAHGGQVAAREL